MSGRACVKWDSALHVACRHRSTTCARLLLDHAAAVDVRDLTGNVRCILHASTGTLSALACSWVAGHRSSNATFTKRRLFSRRASGRGTPVSRCSWRQTRTWTVHDVPDGSSTLFIMLQKMTESMRRGPLKHGARLLCDNGGSTPIDVAGKHTRPMPTVRARRRWRGTCLWICLIRHLKLKAAERVYAPGGNGYENCKRRCVAEGMQA